MQRRFSLRRKLQILKTLTKSKSLKKGSIVMDACVYIHNLKLQIEAIRKHVQEVKVEKIGEGFLSVRVVGCKKGEELMVSILEGFEEMNVEVVEARFMSRHYCSWFGMEAIVQTTLDPALLNQAILMALQTCTHSLK